VQLISTCENVLIKAHREIMQDEFQALLDAEKEEDLNRMYNLLSRIPDGLEPLVKRFEAHVKKAGLDSVERITAEGTDPSDIVRSQLSHRALYNYLTLISIIRNRSNTSMRSSLSTTRIRSS
jgi:cullin 1